MTLLPPSLYGLLDRRDPLLLGGSAFVLAVGAAVAVFRRSRSSPEEMERRRREFLAGNGRITDGLLLDALTDGEPTVSAAPEVLVYSYRLAGVTYECAQDVRFLAEGMPGYRVDQTVQVRYDARNPGNSILLAESWSGLWLPSPVHVPTAG